MVVTMADITAGIMADITAGITVDIMAGIMGITVTIMDMVMVDLVELRLWEVYLEDWQQEHWVLQAMVVIHIRTQHPIQYQHHIQQGTIHMAATQHINNNGESVLSAERAFLVIPINQIFQ
jgi:hypothetical protein